MSSSSSSGKKQGGNKSAKASPSSPSAAKPTIGNNAKASEQPRSPKQKPASPTTKTKTAASPATATTSSSVQTNINVNSNTNVNATNTTSTLTNNNNNNANGTSEADAVVAELMITRDGVIIPTNEIPATPIVEGFHFERGVPVDWDRLMQSYAATGFQASNLGAAINEINRMRKWRLSDDPIYPDEDILDPVERAKVKAKIFLGYTSNLVSSGLREVFVYLAKNKMVDVIVSSAGGVEEDFIKCLGNMYMGEFTLKGATLRARGLNRIGNILAPNENYCKFEEWFEPILDQMLKEQKEQGVLWTPSKFIHRLGKEINDERSIYYWCYKNNIPVFCPSITDGTIGDFLYFYSYKNPGLVLDIISDIRAINDEAVHQRKVGAIILGGGLVKHHIMNACLMRNGTDFCVIVSTAHEFDGSDSGAAPDEAVSWGKIRPYAKPVKVFAEATIVFPLIVASTFAKDA